MDGGASWATVHGVAKSQTRLKRFTSSMLNIIVIVLLLGKLRYKKFKWVFKVKESVSERTGTLT